VDKINLMNLLSAKYYKNLLQKNYVVGKRSFIINRKFNSTNY
jgi:hypothetical protein